ncbi:hypothetical protein BRD05_09730 [Halobacteriales archaeon QS_9_70_65]|nr:MAG: hypothetical protein BRD05_09730 [Halobacteriales archaeon QS_9_70_65]
MCTLVVAWRVFETAPVCVAANRDESFDRPAAPPSVREGDPAVLAPRDERAGGTWLGYNEAGVLAAITNRWAAGDGDRSRGHLVDEALSARTAVDAAARVDAELEARDYAPFHLLVADDDACRLVENGGTDDPLDGHRTRVLAAGVHVVVNVGADGEWFRPPARPDAGRRQADAAARLRETLRPRDGETAADWTARAGDVLADHEFGVCVHGDGFGTRSSSLVRLGDDRVFAFADGPPCRTPYERVDSRI